MSWKDSAERNAAGRANVTAAKNTKSIPNIPNVSRGFGAVNRPPRLAAAIAKITPLRGQHDQHGCRLCRLYREADEALAAELLPAIFGGEWWMAARSYLLSEYTGNTLANCVLVGHPYGIGAEALSQAARLAKAGVGVWTRDDLSSWCPGSTVLVIASPRLTLLNADAFGFGRLA
jgi:hypothetical protein